MLIGNDTCTDFYDTSYRLDFAKKKFAILRFASRHYGNAVSIKQYYRSKLA